MSMDKSGERRCPATALIKSYFLVVLVVDIDRVRLAKCFSFNTFTLNNYLASGFPTRSDTNRPAQL